jgi:hypothetical protein
MPKGLDYKERREYESRLHRIVLESADSIPIEVEAHLNECAGQGLDHQEQAILAHYTRVATQMPRAYADAVIRILAPPKEEEYDAWHHSYDFFDDLGIQRGTEFFPPAPVQGPFLYLLRVNEAEGLRLIQTFTNTAIRNWRRREGMNLPHSAARTPIPLIVQLPHGEARDVWGDEEVYRWFRPLSLGPKAVVSALMALEMWMEEQLEVGRSADDLFAAVLRDVECVAIVGLCLGVAMAFPARCMRAALPLVSSPRIWSYDVNRLVRDTHEGSPGSFFPKWRHIDEIVKLRSERPQRKVDIRQFVMAYMLSPDHALRDAFVAAVSSFSLEAFHSFEEQKTDHDFERHARDLLARFQAIADSANYQATTQPDGSVRVTFQLPKSITAADETFIASYVENDRVTRVLMWADKSLKQRNEGAGYSIEDALAVLSSLSATNAEDDSTMFGRNMRAAFAGAIAIGFIAKYEWMEEQGFLEGGLESLMNIASTPVGAFDPYIDDSRHSFCAEVYAIHGLFAILEKASLDEGVKSRIRELILAKTADSSVQVIEALCENCRRLWETDPVLCQCVASQILAQSLLPKRIAPLSLHVAEFQDWKRDIYDAGMSTLREGASPPFPRMHDVAESYFAEKLGMLALNALPLERLAQVAGSRDELLRLAGDLIERRIVEVSEGDFEARHHNKALLGWIADLMAWAPGDAREKWLAMIREHWPTEPQLTAELLDGYVARRLSLEGPPKPDTVSEWNTICGWVADVPLSESSSGQQEQDAAEAVGFAVFTRFGMCLLDSTWPHAHVFQDTIDRWVSAFGSDASAFRDLAIMLATLGERFAAEIQIDWLNDCHSRVAELHEFVAMNGERTARLLQTIWDRTHSLNGIDGTRAARFARLVDTLVANGVSIAAPLQKRLNAK